MEATDRFGSVLTLRLVRRVNNGHGPSYSATASVGTNGRPENAFEGCSIRLTKTAMDAGTASASTPSADFAAGTRVCGQEQTHLESGKEESDAYLYQCGSPIRPRVHVVYSRAR